MVFWLMVMMALGATALAAPGWVPVRAGDTLAAVRPGRQRLPRPAGHHRSIQPRRSVDGGAVRVHGAGLGRGLDWLLWHALPDRYTLLGAAIIIGSGLYLIRHEGGHAEAEHP